MLDRIFREIYLINNLKARILINNNVINSKKIIIDITKSKIYINSYKIIAIIISR